MGKKKGTSKGKLRSVKKDVFEVSSEDASSVVNVENAESEEEDINMRTLVKQQNRKKKSGGFQSMGLSFSVLKGILRKGYKVPTPIQRKTIPIIVDGKDVVAMARTGSGKTAAFLVPMFEKLQKHVTMGVRALILSPTRELALQTWKFTKELGKYTDLKATCILGGDKMENQFAAIHENPDIIIATPGRFMHVSVEMELKLNTVEYLVFDEADRLFEMGFAEQLKEILRRLPESRQTLLFSATLPKSIIEFARAGLNDPALVRLDVDTKISDLLKTSFFLIRAEDKTAFLLYILENMLKAEEQAFIFTATKHHVEFLKEVLASANIDCAYIYSSMDPTARKINTAKFQKKKVNVMVVTDIAARGIDIPMLDNVINYDFPAKSKLFVHRVGRVARAGRSGRAISMLAHDELAYLVDLHLFLGRSLKLAARDIGKDEDGVLGMVPQELLDHQEEFLRQTFAKSHDLVSLKNVVENACKQYVKSRPLPSSESVARSKLILLQGIDRHPCFGVNEAISVAREDLLSSLRNFKPNQTVFEARGNKKYEEARAVMNVKRMYHEATIEKTKQRMALKLAKDERSLDEDKRSDENLTEYQVQSSRVLKDENYIPHKSSDFHAEKGLEITSFEKEAASIAVDITADDNMKVMEQKRIKKWDRKRKRFVAADEGKGKKVKTESGALISASYKTNLYQEWIEKNRVDVVRDKLLEEEGSNSKLRGKNSPSNPRKNRFPSRDEGMRENQSKKGKLKSKDEILKQRWRKEKRQFRIKQHQLAKGGSEGRRGVKGGRVGRGGKGGGLRKGGRGERGGRGGRGGRVKR